MTNAKDAGFGRRTFLQHMAPAAGAAPLAPALISAASAQTASAHHEETNHETERLAAYAAKLRYEELPGAVVQRAKDCICDTVGAIVYGAELPWSQMIIAYARRTSAPGRSSILGSGGGPVQAGAAGPANGAMNHAFEAGSPTQPHRRSPPGAAPVTAARAGARRRGAGGRGPPPARRGGRRDHVPDRARHQAHQRGARLSRAGHHGAVRCSGRNRVLDGARCA